MPLLNASDLKVSYGEIEIFSGVTLDVSERARIGLVGPNGGGKTSLLRLLVGEQQPDGGQVYRTGRSRVGYVPQSSRAVTGGNIRDEVMVAFEDLRGLEDALAASALDIQRAEAGSRAPAERRYASLLERYESLGGYDYQSHMERVADGVGLTAEVLEYPADSASGGELTRAALARALLSDPDLLVMDEPTNYLDFKGLEWLESYLAGSSHAFIVVSHDRYFLDEVVDQVWELDHGRLESYPGNYTKYRALKAERTAIRVKEYKRQQEFIAREQSFIDRYKAGQRSREAKGREKRLDRLDRLEQPVLAEHVIRIGDVAASRTPRVVVSARGVRLGFVEGGEGVELASIQDMSLERGSRTAIIGSNGTGKTTMLQTILGEVPPLSGAVKIGDRVKVGYLQQGVHDLPESATVLGAMQEYRNISPAEERDYLARFLFREDEVFKQVSSLSGGERTRLAVARLMATAPNFLVLDEPTTHLDIPSREALEDALQAYDGTLLFVSHDRHLISLLATRLIVVEDSQARLFEGTFEEWSRSSGAPPATATQGSANTPARRRVGTTRKKHKKSSQSKREPAPDHEKTIAELESSLARIEGELQAASERQDVSEVTRLGEQHDSTRTALDRAWEAWRE